MGHQAVVESVTLLPHAAPLAIQGPAVLHRAVQGKGMAFEPWAVLLVSAAAEEERV